jgi:hypothetical protein
MFSEDFVMVVDWASGLLDKSSTSTPAIISEILLLERE